MIGGHNFYRHSSISEKYSLDPSPAQWGTPLLMDVREPDDELHNPDPKQDSSKTEWSSFSYRGMSNLGCLSILIVGMLVLLWVFLSHLLLEHRLTWSLLSYQCRYVILRAISPWYPYSRHLGYPLITHLTKERPTTQGGFNLGGINASGQIPELPGNFGLIDKDTPREAYTKPSWHNGEEMVLVFSDEFNEDGRTFYPGDDPYWEAVDIHYWGTNDLEWYDPSQATTRDGALQLTLERVADPSLNHNLEYKSGMVQTWNKFCFTGGLLEASVRLPGSSTIAGLWPAVWALGNLGRAGYGASLEGLWPYSYDSCDVGTLPNQTYPGTSLPEAAVTNGDPYNGDVLSYLPGQRLSACTCRGESHPGPARPDGSYVGRAAPEIDVFEATVHGGMGMVSLSAQWAPYNAQYAIRNSSGEVEFDDPDVTHYNDYVGGVWQQTTSGLAITNQQAYELSGGLFAVYGFEYKPGFDDAYITWINDNKRAWTIYSAALGPDPATEIGARPFPQEPMYIIANLGFSENFGVIEYDQLTFPATMSVDWIRVYQPANRVNIGCDPPEFPTAKYIETYKEVYSNPNLTLWSDSGQPWPKNSLVDQC
ncbi:beta-glucan synthesis-associated protein KRE6 [Coprinopsis cinerea AmutBmut pab1-1]|nr:beta-glucan synthesis-associated protein KRE6 [Coprinopsis cinerea AmutBmut pab1-1]